MKDKYIVFDLDDTLAQELDFLKSAYANIANIIGAANADFYHQMLSFYEQGLNVFDEVVKRYPEFSVEGLLTLYRQHIPDIQLNMGAEELLKACKDKGYKMGLLSDGRSLTQRNKLKVLGIEDVFDKIIISEEFGSTKPNVKNFKIFMENPDCQYYYIANDTGKDFVAPNQLDWISICLLDRGDNIHPQNFELEEKYLPTHCVNNLKEVISML